MSGRPEILFPIFADLQNLSGIGPKLAENFAKLGVERPKDLLFHLPNSVIRRDVRETIQGTEFPSVVTVEVEVGQHYPNQQKNRPYRVQVQDAETSFQLVFFHPNKNWIREQLPSGQRRIVSGKVELFDNTGQMAHPDYIVRVDQADAIPISEAIYPLTQGLTQRNVSKAVIATLALVPELPEWVDKSVVEGRKWPNWKTAIQAVHNPKHLKDLTSNNPAKERLAYDEFLAHQMTLAIARQSKKRAKGLKTIANGKKQAAVLSSLPFKPTKAQSRAVSEILDDMAGRLRMNRLLQGDVGSGKTLVAFLALLGAVEAGGQGVMMAPTEILARQHLEGLQPLAEQAGVVLEILTGRDSGSERAAKLAALAAGDIHILVGTHAVFQKDVVFSDLRLAIIDEQHRFGVRQRMDLGAKGAAVDVLVMTATPIPRSLALTHYGDMDVSILDEKPAGRKPIETVLVSNERLDEVILRLKTAVSEGKQAYWVCPLVEESELVTHTAAEERFRSLKVALGADKVGLVHGQMPNTDKDQAMEQFVQGETKVLVATTVIEVGVNVPNASIMVIEQAENFGLAQLHQLRGRVGRGSEKSTCLLMYDGPLGETAKRRLETMRRTNDGFEIAEEDLNLRGAGDVLGLAQSGLPRFRIANAETQTDLLKTAMDDARMLLNQDPELKSDRGIAMRTLMYLLNFDEYFRLITVG